MPNEITNVDIKHEKHPIKTVFKPSSWLSKIDVINHLLLFKNVVITVLAEQGAGKTTFAHLLESGLESQVKPIAIQANSSFSTADFLAKLANVIGLEESIKIDFSIVVQQVNENKAQILVIIDDAQNLPEAFLEEALQLIKQQTSHSYFHLCLIADFSLAATLDKLEFQSFSDVIRRLEPGVLTEGETKTYLLNALPSPKRLDLTMTDKRLEQFYQLTGGNLARINNQMLNYFCSNACKPTLKSNSLLKRISVLAAVAATWLLFSYVWENHLLLHSVYKPAEEPELTVAESSIEPEILPSNLLSIPPLEPKLVLKSELPDIIQAFNERPSQIPVWHVGAIQEPIRPSPLRVTNIVLDDLDEHDDSLVVMDRVVVIPKNLQKRPVKVINEAKKQKAIIQASSIGLAATKKAPSPLAKSKPPLLKGQFTIQLLASRNQNDIKHFIQTHPIKEKMRIGLTKRDGINWYVLTIGEYGQLNQAKKIIKNLPATFANYKPWVRSTSQLQAVG